MKVIKDFEIARTVEIMLGDELEISVNGQNLSDEKIAIPVLENLGLIKNNYYILPKDTQIISTENNIYTFKINENIVKINLCLDEEEISEYFE